MKLTIEGKSEEIQQILSFMHLKQVDYFSIKETNEFRNADVLDKKWSD
ncbi:hypothetical protein GTO82_07275 [Lactobacillus johnsonii]|uniref:Uncharacterized protein n=1 Tax=Lactobacillus johnsonii TaxID=33959 RepID=A0A9X7TZQ0_LACJH|nr:hypothetical protein [Lactobacillus johnsonii]QLL68649.1 hypothetical protein GTO82_07275 [Lactobacillus johnsonii]